MNKCPINNFKCIFALSEEAPLPCFGTEEQCKEWTQKIENKND